MICRGYIRSPHEESIDQFMTSLRWGRLPYCNDCVEVCKHDSSTKTKGNRLIAYHNKPYYMDLLRCSQCTNFRKTSYFTMVRTTITGFHPSCRDCLNSSSKFKMTLKKKLQMLSEGNITTENLLNQCNEQNGKCAISGLDFKQYLDKFSITINKIENNKFNLIFACFKI